MIRTHHYMREGKVLQDGKIHVVYHSCSNADSLRRKRVPTVFGTCRAS